MVLSNKLALCHEFHRIWDLPSRFHTAIFFFSKKSNKLTLCAAYAACLLFVFLQQLLFSETPLNEKLTVELMLSLCVGKWPWQLLELGKKGKKPWKSPEPSNVFKCNKKRGAMQTLTQSLQEDTVKILFCFADFWTRLSGHSHKQRCCINRETVS